MNRGFWRKGTYNVHKDKRKKEYKRDKQGFKSKGIHKVHKVCQTRDKKDPEKLQTWVTQFGHLGLDRECWGPGQGHVRRGHGVGSEGQARLQIQQVPLVLVQEQVEQHGRKRTKGIQIILNVHKVTLNQNKKGKEYILDPEPPIPSFFQTKRIY